jgi:anti-anti-sigma regulatory factor
MSADTPTIDLAATSDGLYIGVRGRATQRVCPTADQVAGNHLAACEHPPHITIDLAGCDWVDSSFAGWLLGLRKKLARRAGHLRLANCSPRCRVSLERMRLAGLFECVESAAPESLSALACTTTDRPDAQALRVMLAAHEELAASNEQNARVFGPIADMLRRQLESR